MERYCSTGQSPQRAVAPTEEEEMPSIFFSILTDFGFSPHIFTKVPNIKTHTNPFRGNCADICGRTDMNLKGAFRDYANMPRK